jgi:TPR repeat protein
LVLLIFWSSGIHSIFSALNNLGICYELGRGGVGQDLTRASQLYARSASQGNPSAMNNWGFMLVKRAEVAGASRDCSNFRRAALLFRCAVQTDGGWPEEGGEEGGGGGGDFQAGTMSMTDFSHFFGGAGSSSSSSYHSHSAHSSAHSSAHGTSAHGTSAHGTSSFRAATMTAMERRHRRTELRQTNADACFNLATLYEAGYGVERDLQAAYAYYRRAADNPDRPHPKAACRTASMLYSGTHKGETLKTETSRDKTARLAMALHYYKKGEWLRV